MKMMVVLILVLVLVLANLGVLGLDGIGLCITLQPPVTRNIDSVFMMTMAIIVMMMMLVMMMMMKVKMMMKALQARMRFYEGVFR